MAARRGARGTVPGGVRHGLVRLAAELPAAVLVLPRPRARPHRVRDHQLDRRLQPFEAAHRNTARGPRAGKGHVQHVSTSYTRANRASGASLAPQCELISGRTLWREAPRRRHALAEHGGLATEGAVGCCVRHGGLRGCHKPGRRYGVLSHIRPHDDDSTWITPCQLRQHEQRMRSQNR